MARHQSSIEGEAGEPLVTRRVRIRDMDGPACGDDVQLGRREPHGQLRAGQ